MESRKVFEGGIGRGRCAPLLSGQAQDYPDPEAEGNEGHDIHGHRGSLLLPHGIPLEITLLTLNHHSV